MNIIKNKTDKLKEKVKYEVYKGANILLYTEYRYFFSEGSSDIRKSVYEINKIIK